MLVKKAKDGWMEEEREGKRGRKERRGREEGRGRQGGKKSTNTYDKGLICERRWRERKGVEGRKVNGRKEGR